MRHLVWLVIIALAIGQLVAPAGLRAQAACAGAHCLFLPALVRPAPVNFVRGELRYHVVGVMPVGDIYGIFVNSSGAPVCDVTLDYQIDNLTNPDQSGTRTIAVVMPDEEEWRYLDRASDSEYTVAAAVRSWRTAGCSYARLTPIDQTVTVIDYVIMTVAGTVRNDSAQTVYGLRVRLMPGHNASRYYDLQLPDVVLAPGETATYATTMEEWYLTDRISSFRISAIGAVP